jgi:hypothetical protein
MNPKPQTPNSEPQVEAFGTFKGHLTIDNAYTPPSSLLVPGGDAQPESSASNVLVIAAIWCLGFGGLRRESSLLTTYWSEST